MRKVSLRTMFIASCLCCFLTILNSCNQPENSVAGAEKVSVPPSVKKVVKVNTAKSSVKNASSSSVKLSETTGKCKCELKTDTIDLINHSNKLSWWLKAQGEKYLLTLYPNSCSIKSCKTLANSADRKIIQVVSEPFRSDRDSFVIISEITVLKNFPGVFFKVDLKNIGASKAMGNFQLAISMKKGEAFTYKGKQNANIPYSTIKHIKNWVYMPSGDKKGLGLIVNKSMPGLDFMSNLGRKGGGKWITDPKKSNWLLRRFKQAIKANEVETISFALVAADSAQKTAEFCQRIKSEKLFADLKLEKGDDSIQKAKPIVKEDVKPILNPKFYSAEKMSAAEVDKWMKTELPPEQFDLWDGKKDRVFLNGSWKLLKLAGTKNQPKCDYGLKHGFEKANFDDSKWFNQPVPYLWNTMFRDRDGLVDKKKQTGGAPYKNIIFGGVGWYRKNFEVPESYKGKRVVLCFPAAEQEITVYVNGKEVGSHKTLTHDHPASIFHTQYDYCEFDITDALNPSGKNNLAVRCFDDGNFFLYCNRVKPWQLKVYAGIGGIWQEVYLESRPSVYLKKAMLTFKSKDSFATVKAYVVNTGTKSVKEKLRLEFSPWKSKRYTINDGAPFSIDLGEKELKPGENTLIFNFKAPKAKLWSPEVPNLYQMALINQKNQDLGRERIGFREFRAGEDAFYLNGEKIQLFGHQGMWGQECPGRVALMSQMGLVNRGNLIANWFEKYKALNHNIVRNHSTFYPHCFYDIADETGIMVYSENYFKPHEPFFDANGKITDVYCDKLKGVAEEAMRHPSLVAFSLGNELYDSWLLNQKIDTYQHYLDQIYDEFKKSSKSIPLTSSCGRAPSEKSLAITGARPYALIKKVAKSDFSAMHNYTIPWHGNEFAEDDEWYGAFKKYKEAYDIDAGPRVLWNTESIISAIPKPSSGYATVLDKQFRPHIKNGMLDRKWFAKNWEFIGSPKYGTMALNNSVPKFGFLDVVLKDRTPEAQAGFMKRTLELHRRKRKYVAGVVGNVPMIFFADTINSKMEPVYNQKVAEAVKKANQPVLACLDGKWNRNIFSGKNPATPIHIMNDHEGEIKDIVVDIALRALDSKMADIQLAGFKIENLSASEQKSVDYVMAVPENVKSGHYSVILTVKYTYKEEQRQSINDYKTFILNRGDIKLQVASKAKIALFQGSEPGMKLTVDMLGKLGVPFTVIKDAGSLKSFQIAVLPFGSSIYPDGIAKWVSEGGKLLSFAQAKMPSGFPQRTMKNSRYGFFTELILKTHPVLKGLEQSDFRYWNGKRDSIVNKWVADYVLLPLCEGVIASQMTTGSRMGMTIAEYRMGDGVCLLSQVDAVKRFDTDSVATKYLLNTLNYCLGDWTAPNAPVMKAEKQAGPLFKVNPKNAFFIDISGACTMGFTDKVAGDKKGGWTDQGPKNDLSDIATGKQTFNGVPFDIIKPENNDGKSCIVLRGKAVTKTDFLPLKRRIEVNQKAEKLYFLVSSAWCKGGKIGTIKISEESTGGEMFSMYQIDLIKGKNIADWWNAAANKPFEAELGWVGFAGEGMRTNEVGSFIIEWINPTPKKLIQYIEFESAAQAIPAILAITGVKGGE